MPRLLIATKNAHKTAEISALLGSAWEVADMNSFPEVPSPEETGDTFAENAAIKAIASSNLFDGLVLSDDSGLEVDALAGAPGVYSARYAGLEATDADNREKLVRELSAGGSPEPWTARFRCAMALAQNGAVIGAFDGTVEGRVISQARGEGGFGYDPLFIPEGREATFAELPAAVKNGESHRSRALAKVVAFLSAFGNEARG